MAQLSQLLLFDPDPSSLDTLTYGFEKEGCSVTATGDAVKARDLIQGAIPPLVVVNLRESEQLGLDLLRATTSNPRTRNLACVAIGRDDLRSAAMAAGAFAFLATPLFLRDVLGACRMVAAAAVPGSRPSPEAELSLKLTDVDGVYFLVRTLAVTGRSAVVDIRRDGKRGELRFIDGTLCSAQVGAVEGFPALHHLLLWEEASLGFKFKNVVRRGAQLSVKSSAVIEECDRFLRDFAHEVRDLGVARTLYLPDLERIQPSAALPSEVVPILKLFDGQHDLGQILEESPFRVFDTIKIVRRFVADEAIKTQAPLPLPLRDFAGTLDGPSALDYWLQKSAPVLGPEVGTGRRADSVSAPGAVAASSARARISGSLGALVAAEATPPTDIEAAKRRRSAAKGELVSDGGHRGRSTEIASSAAPSARDHGDAAMPSIVVTESVVAESVVAESVAAESAARSPEAAPVPPVVTATLETPPAVVKPVPAPAVASIAAAVAEPTSAATATTDEAASPPMPVTDAPSNPVAAAARGEITVGPSRPPEVRPAPAAVVPTIVVDVEVLPVALPGPITPIAVAELAPMAAASLPSVIVAPMTPAPVLVAVPQNHAPAAPAEAPVPADARANPRHHAENFNAVESDFFEREADLYRREAVESFEDLDGGSPSRLQPVPNGPARKP